MSEHNFTVIIAGHGVPHAGEITLKLNDIELNPAKYDDWLLGGHYLKLADADNFDGWVSWSCQSKGTVASLDDMTRRWESFTEVVTGHPPVTDLAPVIDGQAGELVDSPKNAIAIALDRFTDVSGNAVHVTDLAGLQEALNEIITPAVAAPQVLQARGKTMIELVALGLLNDDDMANHMADCFTAITGKPCTAKHAEAFIASLRGLQTLLSGVAVHPGDAQKP